MLGARHPDDSRPGGLFPPGGVLDRASVADVVVGKDRLPATPEIAMATLAYLEREDCNLIDLAAFVASDQAIAAGILRLANSPAFGLRGRIGSIKQAVMLLGFSRVKNLVLGLSVWHAFRGEDRSTIRYRIWRHSVLVSGTARVLAKRLALDDTEAFTGGLVHDVGKLVLGVRFGAPYWDLLAEAEDDDARLARIEEERIGCNHATVGGGLLHRWHVPASLAEMVSRHHEPVVKTGPASVIALADRLVDATDPATGVADPAAFAALEDVHPGILGPEEWAAIHANIVADQESIAELFD